MIDRAERHPPAETFVAESGVKSVEEVCHLRETGKIRRSLRRWDLTLTAKFPALLNK
jgi:hypothetical protein